MASPTRRSLHQNEAFRSEIDDLATAGGRSSGLAKEAGAVEKGGPRLPAGEEPTQESIRQGTVRMEEHPEYSRLKSEMEAAGYPLEPGDPPPRVERLQFVDRAGSVLREEQRIVVQPGMRFLDLEHEAGHVRQLTQRFGDSPPFTARLEERPGLPPREARDPSGVLSMKQNAIAEFHNRLQEYNRLAERGVSPELLAEHERGIHVWHERYTNAVEGWQGRPTKLTPWASEHFGDIRTLIRRYRSLGGRLEARLP